MLLFGTTPPHVSDDTLLIEQLQQNLNQTRDISKKVETLNELCLQYRNIDPKKAIIYGNQAVELAKTIANKKYLGDAYYNLGAAYAMSGDLIKFTKLVYESLEVREAIRDSNGIAQSYNGLGWALINDNKPQKALAYYQKSLSIQKKLKNSKYLNITLGNLGALYFTLKQYDKALYYYKESLALENRADKPITLYNIGLLYLENHKQPVKALPYFKQALEISEETGNKFDKLNALGGIARAYFYMKQYSLAMQAAQEKLTISKETGFVAEVIKSLEALKEIHTARGDHEQALKYLNLYIQNKDTLYSQEKEKLLAEMHTKYETEKKESENKRLKAEYELNQRILEKKNLIQYTIGILLIFVAVMALILFRSKQRVGAINKTLLLKNTEILEKNQEISSKRDELEQLNQLKDKLFSILAHDLRSPLISLKALLEILSLGAVPEYDIKRAIKNLEAEQKNTIALLDNLLIWAKAQMSGMQPKPKHQPLYQLVQENIILLTPQANEKKIILENLVSQSLMIYADTEMIKLVIRNLIANAIKFCHSGDFIQISATAIEDNIQVAVKDTGVGISKENQLKIFQLDGHVSNGTHQEKGTGLGLTLCKDFVEKNKGTIWVESDPGKGANFIFTLPKSTESAEKEFENQVMDFKQI